MLRKYLLGVLTCSLLCGALSRPAAAEEKPALAGGGITGLQAVTLLVLDQDKALEWYTQKLGFEKKVDQQFGPGQRWLTIVPKGKSAPEIVLQKASQEQEALVGKNLDWIFESDDCRKAYESFHAKGVTFTKEPVVQPWGVQATFQDLYGNKFTLISAH